MQGVQQAWRNKLGDLCALTQRLRNVNYAINVYSSGRDSLVEKIYMKFYNLDFVHFATHESYRLRKRYSRQLVRSTVSSPCAEVDFTELQLNRPAKIGGGHYCFSSICGPFHPDCKFFYTQAENGLIMR